MVIGISVGIMAVAFVVFVAYLVPTLIQIRRAVAQSEQLLVALNRELPGLLAEFHHAAAGLNQTVEDARMGVEHAAVLLHAVGNVGDTVQQVHERLRGRGTGLLVNMASILAGVKAASSVLKRRVHEEGGNSNGG